MEELPKILIIDDEEIILDSCNQILAGGDYLIVTAMNGSLGLEMLTKFKPDLVFVDLKMPGLSGFEVLEKINEYDPTIVTVVITGFATVSSAVEAMKKGAYDFLPKPFTPDELRLITRRALDKRSLVLETIALRRERELLRDHFAAIVSHELKSPLGAVQQNLYTLSEELADKFTAEQAKLFERIQIRIDDLVKLIHTWLRVISVDIGNIRESFKPLSLESIISKSVDISQPHAIRKDIEIQVSIDEPLNLIFGDEGTLLEAFINILGNAVKYSRLSSQINVSAKNLIDGVSVSIADQGVGISPEDLAHIFEDFYVGRTAPLDARGSGLGLAITKRIIETHDGTITAESELGKGSTFLIYLPKFDSEKHTELSDQSIAQP